MPPVRFEIERPRREVIVPPYGVGIVRYVHRDEENPPPPVR